MKVTIDLAADVAESVSAKAPKFALLKVSGKKTLVVASSASKEFKQGVALASKAHKGVGTLQKLRGNLLSATKKRDAAKTPEAKKREAANVKTIKQKIAAAKKQIGADNSAASKALKVFGNGISVPFTTAELTSPTKAKSAKLKTYNGVKVKGVTGFVKAAKSVKDDKLAEAVAKKPAKAAKPAAKPAAAKAKKPAAKPAKAKKAAKESPAVMKARINGVKMTPAQIAKKNASYAAMKKDHAAEDRAHLKNVNAAFGTKLKKSELKGAKVATNKLGAIKLTMRDGTVHTLAGSLAKKAGIDRDVLDLIIPE